MEMELDDITYIIRGAIFKVHATLGAGLFESVYEAALIHEIKKEISNVQSQVGLSVIYDNVDLGLGFRLDLLVADKVIVEIKSVEKLQDVHKKQLLNYLKLSQKKVGILVNFNVATLVSKESIIRIIN
jgi:GxxExxY protein